MTHHAASLRFGVDLLERLATTQSRALGPDDAPAVLVEDIETMADALRLAIGVIGGAPPAAPAPLLLPGPRSTEERLAEKQGRLTTEQKREQKRAYQRAWHAKRKAEAAAP